MNNDIDRIHNDYLDPDKYGLFDDEIPESNSTVIELIKEYGNPYSLYRSIYKAGIGHSIGIEIDGGMVYCNDLPTEFNPEKHVYSAISVSSIVEGSDVEIPGETLFGNFTKPQFWELVDSVAEEVKFYWERDNSVYLELFDTTNKETLYVSQSATTDKFYSSNDDIKLAQQAIAAHWENKQFISYNNVVYSIKQYYPNYEF